MSLIILIIGIVLLFILIMGVKLNAFFSLLLTALFVGLFQGMEPATLIASIEKGFGGTLGHLGIIVGLGAIIGKVISEGGGAQRIATTLIDAFGKKNVDWAIMITSFLLGAILFWEVSFVLIIPIVYTVAREADVKFLKVAIPFLAAINVTHCFLPPHPGPVAISAVLGANIGMVMAYGIVLAIPAAIIFGPLYAKMFQRWDIQIPHHLAPEKKFNLEELPGFGLSVFTALLPVALILIGVLCGFILPEESEAYRVIAFISNGDIALLIGAIFAIWAFGLNKKRKTMKEMMQVVVSALMSMGGIIFIIGAGGAFKQVILDSGIAEYIGDMTSSWTIEPLILAWLIAIFIRVAVGSATVTVMTASAIVLPIMTATGADPNLMVISIACASLFASPPTDVAFWMVKEYFNFNMSQSVKCMCVQSALVSTFGLVGVLILNMIVH